MVTDDDAVGVVSIIATDLGNINEGSFGTTRISLSQAPTSNVTLSITAGGHVSGISAPLLTFTSGNYNTNRSVRITVFDNTFVGDVPIEVTISVIGGPSDYRSLPALVVLRNDNRRSDRSNKSTTSWYRRRKCSLLWME